MKSISLVVACVLSVLCFWGYMYFDLELNNINTEIDRLEQVVDEVRNNQLKIVQTNSELLANLYMNFPKFALINTNGEFGVCFGGYGFFLISVKDITSYATGSKLRIHLGNITGAIISNVDIAYQYSPKTENPPFDAKWESGNRTYLNAMSPGKWHVIDLVIPDYSPNELNNFFQISISPKTVQLGNGNQ